MSNQNNIFEMMKSGKEVYQDHPQYNDFMDIVAKTLKQNLALNNADNVMDVREKLSEIIESKIDESTAIFAPFHINFGKHTIIGKNVYINHACSFLDLGGITIEDDVLIGPKVNLITENHPLDPNNRKTLICKPILIKRNAWIGAASTILPGVIIGENAVVAAGSVVTKDVPSNTVVAGVPAKHVKNIKI
ncbi:MAG: sugar O-acetyltransferase [Sediminibacterium sp.]|jgi:acetyltransferase-like isoleucine patch superfamily enzyme|nr:MAG: sugar O-acetyltransferase [Sediminibacterium sp.]